jgi:hypothetical protein
MLSPYSAGAGALVDARYAQGELRYNELKYKPMTLPDRVSGAVSSVAFSIQENDTVLQFAHAE